MFFIFFLYTLVIVFAVCTATFLEMAPGLLSVYELFFFLVNKDINVNKI